MKNVRQELIDWTKTVQLQANNSKKITFESQFISRQLGRVARMLAKPGGCCGQIENLHGVIEETLAEHEKGKHQLTKQSVARLKKACGTCPHQKAH